MLITLRLLNSLQLQIVFGPHLDLETVNSAKQIFSTFGLLKAYSPYSDYSSCYISSIRVKDVETYSNFLSVNSYLRNEIPLLNSRVRKSNNFYMSNFKFFGVGVGSNYFTYPVKLISNNTNSLLNLLKGKSYTSKLFVSIKNNLVVFYRLGLTSYFNKTFKSLINPLFIKIDNSVSNLISAHLSLDTVKSNTLYYSSYSIGSNLDIVYSPTIYQGHHGLSYTSTSYVIMPSTVFSEKTSNFLNLEGVMQKAHAAISSEPLVKKDEDIFKALNEFSIILNLKPAFKNLYAFVNLDLPFNLGFPYWVNNTSYFTNNQKNLNLLRNHMFSLKVLNYY